MRVGVIIPVFNRLSRLRRAVESVLAQQRTGLDFDLVVVDDASTRDLSAVRSVVKGAGHSWISQSANRGPAAARNAGVAVLSAEIEWLAFLDSDDEWLPGKLAAQIEWVQADPAVRVFQCREKWMRDGQPAKRPQRLREPEGEIFSECVERCCISPSAVMLRRYLFEEIGGFDERYRVCEDYQLWLRIALREEVGLLDQELVIKHGGEDDQLTAIVPAFDRWRLRALLEMLPMAAERTEAVRLGIVEKARILQRGADRQGNSEAAEIYEEIGEWATAWTQGSEVRESLSSLARACAM
jgi:glycosyltransferase involved in cell wall biosynthesis